MKNIIKPIFYPENIISDKKTIGYELLGEPEFIFNKLEEFESKGFIPKMGIYKVRNRYKVSVELPAS